MTALELAFGFTLPHEGGYVNDPKDPGGETKFGISKRSYPSLDIKNLTLEKAKEIYIRDYWNELSCNTFTTSLAIAAFDTAVLCGVSRTRRWLKESFYEVDAFLSIREEFHNASRQERFKKGWLNRVADLRRYIKKNAPN